MELTTLQFKTAYAAQLLQAQVETDCKLAKQKHERHIILLEYSSAAEKVIKNSQSLAEAKDQLQKVVNFYEEQERWAQSCFVERE